MRWNQVQGAGRPGARLKSSHHALSEALPQPIWGFLGGVGCGTVMLKPLAVQGFRIVLQLALECPPKFRQHRTIALGFVGLGVAAAIFEVGL